MSPTRPAAPVTPLPLATSTFTLTGARGGAVVVVEAAVVLGAVRCTVVTVAPARRLDANGSLPLSNLLSRTMPRTTATASSRAPRPAAPPADWANDASPAAWRPRLNGPAVP